MDTDSIKSHIERTIKLHSTGALQDFHRAIRDGLAKEDALGPDVARKHGFREQLDFRWEADAVQEELRRRGEPVAPIVW